LTDLGLCVTIAYNNIERSTSMKKRATISLDEKDMRWLDKTAKRTRRTRSGVIGFLIGSAQARENKAMLIAESPWDRFGYLPHIGRGDNAEP